MRKLGEIEEITRLIFGCDNIVISAHTGPDGDAIGSVSALFLALKSMNKKVYAALEEFPEKFLNIPGSEHIKHNLPDEIIVDLFISMDCGDKARLGVFEKYFDRAAVTVNIDHHASNDRFGKYNYVDAEASATCEIVYTMLEQIGFKLNKDIAAALYSGILYDTGGFRHRSTSAYTYRVAADLIENGADFYALMKKFFFTRTYAETQMLSIALKKIRRMYDNRFVLTNITLDEMTQNNALPDDLDNIVDFARSVEGAKIAVFIYPKAERETKLSFRSEEGYDVNLIAQKFGGGGHKNAAGASLFCEMDEAIEKVIDVISKVFEKEV